MTLYADILEAITLHVTNMPDDEDCRAMATAAYLVVCDSFAELDRDIRE